MNAQDLPAPAVCAVEALNTAVRTRDWFGAAAAAARGEAQIALARATAQFNTSDPVGSAANLTDQSRAAASSAVQGLRHLAECPPPEPSAVSATLRALANLAATALAVLEDTISVPVIEASASP